MRGPLQVANTNGPVAVIGTKVSGPVNLVNSTGGAAPYLAGNSVSGPLNCSGNSPAPTNLEVRNTVNGPRAGQCATL